MAGGSSTFAPCATPLTSLLLLLSLLLLQSAGFGITLAWRTLAAESFTARFCVNRATEEVHQPVS
ncbi:hypothetical protein [Neolewinella sp.]|uniref:hypothetical protein n=1 Tax=Neolewinella sp. TaxID=2993543 RepID=UPI003B52B593